MEASYSLSANVSVKQVDEFRGLSNKNKFKIRNNLIDKAKEIEDK